MKIKKLFSDSHDLSSPCLVEDSQGTIVFTTREEPDLISFSGFVLLSKYNFVGEYRDTWLKSEFKKFRGSIILENN